MNDTKECPTSETDYIFDIYSSGRYITFWNNYTYYEGETKMVFLMDMELNMQVLNGFFVSAG